MLVFVSCVTLLGTTIATSESVQVRIEQPQQDSEVGQHEIVRGKVSDTNARVYVLVHPMMTNLWWVQRLPSPPNQDGSWQTLCYFGTETEGKNEYFEVIAIVTHKNLKEGQILKELPSDAIRSDIIMVKRTR